MLVNSLKHLNIEQNKTMMVHYVKVEFYVLLVKLCHYEEWIFDSASKIIKYYFVKGNDDKV